MTRELTPEIEQLLTLLMHGEGRAAVGVIDALVAGGVEPVTLVEELLVPLQRRVGEQREQGAIGDSDVHRATVVVEAALDVIEAKAIARSSRCLSPTAVIAFPPGEWHTIPARFVATMLRLDGWDVPAPNVTRSIQGVLAASGDDVPVLVSCTLTANLYACARLIDALHRHG